MPYLKYALLLCMHEPLIALIPGMLRINPERLLASGDVPALLVGLLGVTAYRVALNAPFMALSLRALRRHGRSLSRLGVSLVNLGVYATVVAVLALLGGVDDPQELPEVVLWFAGACLLSPLLPWLRPPADADASSS